MTLPTETTAQQAKLEALPDGCHVAGWQDQDILVRRPNGDVSRILPDGTSRPANIGTDAALARRRWHLERS